MKIILASASPRRKVLCEGLGLTVTTIPANIVEQKAKNEGAKDYVMRLALEKASFVAKSIENMSCPLLAADTTVMCDGEILEKPKDREDAKRILSILRGKKHFVYTAVCILDTNKQVLSHFCVETSVTFGYFSDSALQSFVDSGEADDKAGAYGIQGRAAVFVESIQGSYSNVVGLPLYETAKALGIL